MLLEGAEAFFHNGGQLGFWRVYSATRVSPFQHKEIPMSDQSLRQDVIDELQFEASLDAANIGVARKMAS